MVGQHQSQRINSVNRSENSCLSRAPERAVKFSCAGVSSLDISRSETRSQVGEDLHILHPESFSSPLNPRTETLFNQ